MLTIVDGYNLLFGRNIDYHILKDDREDLILTLVQLLELAKMEAIIVFDAYMEESPETKGNFGPLEMIFTDKGELADDFILKKIKASTKPHQILVVTSDKRLGMRVRRLLAKVISTKEWFASLKKLAIKKEKSEKHPPKQTPPQQPVPLPVKHLIRREGPEHDFDFYLDVFETKYQAEKEEIKPVSVKQAPKKKRAAKKMAPEDPTLSEQERWLKLFNNRHEEL